MRNQHHGAAKLAYLLLQPGNGRNIQMVGRLVQQQHVGIVHQCLCQRHATPPAPGQRGHRRIGRQ